jgi:hypothetical protein
MCERIYLARDIKSDTELQRGLAQLPSPWLLTSMEEMVLYLINAIEQQKKIVIVADFDLYAGLFRHLHTGQTGNTIVYRDQHFCLLCDNQFNNFRR